MNDHSSKRAAQRVRDAMSRRSALRRLGAGGLAVGAAVGVERATTGAQFSFSTPATAAAARRAVSAINQALATGDMRALDSAFAADYVNRTPRVSFATGQPFAADLAGLKTSLSEVRAAVPDAVILVDDIVAAGDTAAVRGTFRGTLDPAVLSVPAGTDPRLRIGGAAFGRFVAGKVAESWEYDDAAIRYGGITSVAPSPTETPVADDGRGETRDVRDFNAVSLAGVGLLQITQGESESLTIAAEERVLRRIETEVTDGTLYIRPDQSFTAREPIVYTLGVVNLSGIELSGAGQVEMARLDSAELQLNLSGAGSIAIEELAAETLDVEASGNVAVTLGGTVDSQTVTLSGAGVYDASNLASRVATITADGASQATVSVSESLEASASGASGITYSGDPAVSESTSGVGSVTRAG